VHAPKSGGRAAVLSFANRGEEVRVRLITPVRKVLTYASADFEEVPLVLAHLSLPQPYLPNDRSFQHQVARRLQHAKLRYPDQPRDRGDREAAGRRALAAVAAHPVSRCPDAERHLRALHHAERLQAEVADLRRSVKGRTESLARRFDRVLRVMEAWDFLSGWQLTDKGQGLLRLYHECDLLIAEALATGLFDGLDAPAMAGLAACLTYEHRSPAPPAAPWFPSAEVRQRWGALERLADELNADEHDAGLPLTRRPDPGFFAIAHAWAAGEDLDEVLADEDLSGGDFVRNVKQLIDLLRQLGQVADDPATAASARRAADALFRGVVSASTVMSDAEVVDAADAGEVIGATGDGEVPARLEGT
jgi:ATP-dependent RNA helicase HelY